jgi:putative transcriptional regulator
MKTDLQLKIIFKIKSLRENENVSQTLLSEELKLSSNGSIGNIESSKYSHKYTIEQLKMACDYFNFPFPLLFISEKDFQEKDKEEVVELLINKIIEYVK